MNHNKYKTLYELANDIDSDVQNEGLPRLAEWLFKSYYNKFEGDIQKAIVIEFINSFIRKYLNREIFHINKEVFKSTLYYELNKYFDYLSTVQDEYKNLITAEVSLKETDNTDRNMMDFTRFDNTINRELNSTSDNTGTQTTTGEATRTDNLSSVTTGNNTNEQTNSSNSTRTDNLKSDSKSTQTGTNGIAERSIASDYPQSNVGQGVDPVFNYDYASGASDRHTTETRDLGGTDSITNTGTQTNESTDTINNTTNINNTTSNTGTQNNSVNQTREDNLSNKVNATENNTQTSNNDKTVNDEIRRIRVKDSISAFDKLLKILEYLDKNPYSPIYTVIEKLNKYFISMYVDEDRDGYMNTDIDLFKYIIGGSNNE